MGLGVGDVPPTCKPLWAITVGSLHFFCGGSTEKPVEGEVGSSSHFKEEPGCCMNGCPGGDVCIRKDSDEGTCSQDC